MGDLQSSGTVCQVRKKAISHRSEIKFLKVMVVFKEIYMFFEFVGKLLVEACSLAHKAMKDNLYDIFLIPYFKRFHTLTSNDLIL